MKLLFGTGRTTSGITIGEKSSNLNRSYKSVEGGKRISEPIRRVKRKIKTIGQYQENSRDFK
jgi:hypothetical protein